MRPPLVGGELWTPVMEAAEYQCQCVDHCGRKHAGGRCPKVDRSDRAGQFLAAVSMAETWIEASASKPDALMALCPACHGGVLRRNRKGAAVELMEDQGPLW